MAKSTPCRCKKTECEECPEWIFTFADLVMLMMGFFVILWVLKPSPTKVSAAEPGNQDWVKVAAAIREAFGYVPDPKSTDPVDVQMLLSKIQRPKVDGPGQRGRADHETKAAEGHDDDVTSIRASKYATEGGKLCFDRGDAALGPAAKGALGEIADAVRGHRNLIVVKGHASLDDFPNGGTAEGKMDLSLRRAQVASDYLRSIGVDAALLRVQGCSTFEPVVRRQYSPEALVANRRVEIETTATLVEDFQDHQPPSAPAVPPTLPATNP